MPHVLQNLHTDSHLMIIGVCVLAVALVALVAMLSTKPPKESDNVAMRMQALTGAALKETSDNVSISDTELKFSAWSRIVLPMLQNLGELAVKISPGGATDLLRKRLASAGSPRGLGVIEFIGARLLCGVAGFFGAFLAQSFLPDFTSKLAVGVLTFGILFMIPELLLSKMIEARQYKVKKVLADTIDLLVVSVEAGMGFDGAIQKVVEKMKGPLAEEFGRVLHEMKLGKPRARSLKDMAARLNVTEITTFVAAIYQSELLGVSISTVLRVQSESIRIAHTQRIRESAAKLPVKMLFPLVFLIFPAIFLVLLGPGLISIKNALGSLK